MPFPPLSGGFMQSIPPWVLLGAGVVAGGLRTAGDFIYKHTIGYLINRISLSLQVEDTDHPEAYAWLSQWVEKHLKGQGISSLLLRQKVPSSSDPTPSEHRSSGAEYTLIPSYGTYYMRWKSKYPMIVEHWPDEAPTGGIGGVARKMHWLKIQVWFTRKRSIINEILAEAKAEYAAQIPDHVKFYRYVSYVGWESVALTPRSMDSLYFPEEQMADLVNDVQTFLDSKAKYRELGHPYRRGIELEGPPGTGKSTLILALASHFKVPIYLISLQSEGMDGDRLMKMLSQCEKPSFLVFEDIDCLVAAKTREPSEASRLTTSDLLNAIDGIGATEERIVFMTTNFPDSLDPALTRSGRIDRKFRIDFAQDEELRRFYDRVTPLFPQPEWEEFRASLPEFATIADAQAQAFRGSV